MRLRASSSLGHDNAVGRQHAIHLNGSFVASGLFESRDPALELSVRADEIRRAFVGLFLETHMPELLADSGYNGNSPSEAHSEFDYEGNNQWSVADQPDGPALTNEFAIDFNVRTDCDTHPAQAASLIRANIAEAVAEQVMGALAKQYLGLDQTSSETEFGTRNGRLAEYEVREGSPE